MDDLLKDGLLSHVHSCNECRQNVHQAEKLQTELKNLPIPSIDADFAKRALSHAAKKKRSTSMNLMDRTQEQKMTEGSNSAAENRSQMKEGIDTIMDGSSQMRDGMDSVMENSDQIKEDTRLSMTGFRYKMI